MFIPSLYLSIHTLYFIDTYPNGYMLPWDYVEYMQQLKHTMLNSGHGSTSSSGTSSGTTSGTGANNANNGDIHTNTHNKDSTTTTTTTSKSTSTSTAPSFGLLGSPGFSTGVFLRSPYSTSGTETGTSGTGVGTSGTETGTSGTGVGLDVPDIQVTMFPSVSDICE